jgi:L,D-transpeptidase YcbB
VRALLIGSFALVALVLLVTLGAVESGSGIYPIQGRIKERIDRGGLPSFPDARGGLKESLARFYAERHYRPAWVNAAGPLPRARLLVEELSRAGEEGLNSLDYAPKELRGLLERARGAPLGPRPSLERLAGLDLLLSHAFLSYASDLFDGRVDPRRLPADWHTRPRRTDWAKTLSAACSSPGVHRTLQELEPPHRGYARLKEALHRYLEIREDGGWPRVPPGPPLRRGSHGSRVLLLRRRLARSGELGTYQTRSAVYDATLEHAVRGFQVSMGLEPTGRVGRQELAELNMPLDGRIRRIALNMERWRWLPARLGERYLLVNIPDFTLRLMEHDRSRWSMRVVVGKEYTRTPVFSDTLVAVVFNPSWNVPQSIAETELAESIDADHDYLTRHRMHVDENGAIREEPGPDNPLGRIKFTFPNRFNIYLHDTPAGHLFERQERDFSHGCIRVENAEMLAEYLLRGKPGWGASRIRSESAAADETVSVPHPIPVHILYWTAWADDQGKVEFRDDLYGIDSVLERALQSRAIASR